MLNVKFRNSLSVFIILLATFKYYASFMGINYLSKFVMLISLAVSAVLISTDYKKYNFLHILILIFAIIQFIISKNITLIYVYFISLGLYTGDFRCLLKWFIIINSTFFTIFLLCNLLSIYPTVYIEGRNDFGFGNPNSAFICFFLVWSSYFCYNFNSKKRVDFFVLAVSVLLMYTQTITRTGLISAISTAIAFFILKKVDVFKPRVAYFLAAFPLVMSILSLMIAIFGKDAYYLNNFLSHRPLYWNSYLTHTTNGLNFFGYIPNIRDVLFSQRMPLDSGYIWTLYSMGVLSFILLIFIQCYTIYILCIENQKDKVLLIISVLIYSFAESILVDIASNISIILLVYGISKFDIKSISLNKMKLQRPKKFRKKIG